VGFTFGNNVGYVVTGTVGEGVGTVVGTTFGDIMGFRETVGVLVGVAVGSVTSPGIYTARMDRELPPLLEAVRVTQ
jgi:predicted MFS family arabinose efflux permease